MHTSPLFLLRKCLHLPLYLLAIASGVFAQQPASQPRIIQAIDETRLSVLRGNTHPLALAHYDQGAASPSLPLQRMLLVLQRSADQETALRQLLDEQQDKSSPNYHKWLAPEEFGKRFGPAHADVQSLRSWLQSHGFQIAQVSKGRTVIEFSGTAAAVKEAFHTEIHKYVVTGSRDKYAAQFSSASAIARSGSGFSCTRHRGVYVGAAVVYHPGRLRCAVLRMLRGRTV